MAYRSYFRSVLNDNFKILTWVLILFISITPNFIFIKSVHASAAEKWEYDVIPDQNQKLKVTGHKVDQYGDAVNDNNYTTTIDPKTTSNKQKMGKVGMSRLLKISGWGMLGYEALAALLEAVDWVIDPEAQSIWRHKKKDNTGVSCSYTQNYNGKVYSVVFKDSYQDFHSCPLEAAKHRIQYHAETQHRTVKVGSGRFLRWDTTDFSTGVQYFYADYIVQDGLPNEGQRTPEYRQSVNAARDKEIVPEKEILTEQDLADYANRTHKDYSNPELAPKLEPKYKPSIQTDLWKPSNKFEEENSPTVQEAQRQLEQANPTSKDKDIEQKTDEEGNPTGSFSLPEFCSWATPVCDFIKWVKEQPENDENTEIEVENLDETLIFDDSQRFTFADSCPSPEQFSVSFFGTTQNLEFSYQPLCDFMSMIKPFVVAGSYLIGAYIVMGLSRGSGD